MATDTLAVTRLLILYASQTGSAQEVAETLGRLASRRNFLVSMSAMNSYNRMNLVDEKLVIFVASTTGDGDPPDNMRVFWNFLLRKGLPKDVLSTMKFAVFGLGDSSYPKFNSVARKLRTRLKQLGATEIAEPGWGDDQSVYGLEGDFDTWTSKLWTQVFRHYPLPSDFIIDDSPKLVESRFEVVSHPSKPSSPSLDVFYSQLSAPIGAYGDQKVVLGKMLDCERISASDWEQDVRHIKIALPKPINYEAGDIAVIQPKNVFDAPRLMKRLGLNPDDMIEVVERESEQTVMGPCSIRDLFVHYLDVLGTPKRSVFETLSFFCQDEEEKEKMIELTTAEGNDLYHSYCKKEFRTFVELFDDFCSCSPSLEYLLQVIPPLQPREYSICSSPSKHGCSSIQLTVALVDFLTPTLRKKVGVCSSWLKQLAEESNPEIPLWIKKGTLRVRRDETPLLLVGPGTGVAPMRALIYERATLGIRNTTLFFGCRSSTKDYYYKEEWEKLKENGFLKEVFVAFSRDQDRKIYVQHLMQRNGAEVYDSIVKLGGSLYISGSAKRMPSDVKDSVVDILVTHGKMSKIQAEKYVKLMERDGRYRIEAWS